MNGIPKSLRRTIVLAGRGNVGKSTLLNYIAGQDVAIASPVVGTTTDPVEKSMELRPLGPVLFIDTAGLDDATGLGEARRARSNAALERADVTVLVARPDQWGEFERSMAEGRRGGFAVVFSHAGSCPVPAEIAEWLTERKIGFIAYDAERCSPEERSAFLDRFTALAAAALPEEDAPPLLGDLVKPGDHLVMIVPVDIQAPRGRLILPQQQCLRDALDHDCSVTVCKAAEYPAVLKNFRVPPALVICDSQVVMEMVRDTPAGVPCTTFSILFSRLKGDMALLRKGVEALKTLRDGDRVLVAEACTHHASCEDIGRVKIPRMLAAALGTKLEFDFVSGHDFPADPGAYRVIVHCGSCMLNRRETLHRLNRAAASGVPVVNYGMLISFCQGVLERVMEPFDAARRD